MSWNKGILSITDPKGRYMGMQDVAGGFLTGTCVDISIQGPANKPTCVVVTVYAEEDRGKKLEEIRTIAVKADYERHSTPMAFSLLLKFAKSYFKLAEMENLSTGYHYYMYGNNGYGYELTPEVFHDPNYTWKTYLLEKHQLNLPPSADSVDKLEIKDRTKLRAYVIADGVTEIGTDAFYGCSGLTSVKIPDSVTKIGEYAFYDCSGLTSVKIPDSVTEIGGNAFYGCTGLTSVTIPTGVTEIGACAFYDCSGLTSVKIPDSVTKIGKFAFYGCTGLTSVTIPASVTEIGKYAFENVSHIVYHGSAKSDDN